VADWRPSLYRLTKSPQGSGRRGDRRSTTELRPLKFSLRSNFRVVSNL